MSGDSGDDFPPIVELNVGGVFYTTSLSTLTKVPDSLLGQLFTSKNKTQLLKDSKNKYFIDRDGVLFRYVLDYLRNHKLVLPENFHEKHRLSQEADYFQLPDMMSSITLTPTKLSTPLAVTGVGQNEIGGKGFINVSYRGTFAFGRDGLADVKFRKLTRILICGRVSLCREVFGDTLNESRDPDRGTEDRYTSRFFLKHMFLEQAFDMLSDAGFCMVGSCASGTNSAGEVKPGMDNEEGKWNHYNEFIFARV